jgi:hypothetical protein
MHLSVLPLDTVATQTKEQCPMAGFQLYRQAAPSWLGVGGAHPLEGVATHNSHQDQAVLLQPLIAALPPTHTCAVYTSSSTHTACLSWWGAGL